MPVLLNEIREARYLPELVPHALALTLGPRASEPIFPVQSNWNQRLVPPRRLTLTAVAWQPHADLQLNLTVDDQQDSFDGAAGRTWPETVEELEAPAYRQLFLQALNQSGTGTISNLILRFGLWVEPITPVIRAFAGLDLSAQDQAALQAFDPEGVQVGDLPQSRQAYIQLVRRRLIKAFFVGGPDSYTVGPDEVGVRTLRTNPGEALVLVSLAASATTVTNPVADNVRLYVARDGQSRYVDFPLYALDLDHPMPCFIPATQSLAISLEGAGLTGTQQVTVNLRIGVWRIRLSDKLRLLWGLVGPEQVSERVRREIAAGVF